MRLNGWQRLWIVGMALSFVIGATITVVNLPSDRPPRLTTVGGPLPETRDASPPYILLPPPPETEEQRASNQAILAAENKKRADETEKAAEEARALGMKRRRDILIMAGLTWLALGALVYALGWSVGWVRRGF